MRVMPSDLARSTIACASAGPSSLPQPHSGAPNCQAPSPMTEVRSPQASTERMIGPPASGLARGGEVRLQHAGERREAPQHVDPRVEEPLDLQAVHYGQDDGDEPLEVDVLADLPGGLRLPQPVQEPAADRLVAL